ncbi:hypothetical protein XENOCAPTIV_014971 [Xenoophorus captivus]|uniref:Uncharacterized protein n=1 Tax=Xenoophorus captivus TaxID=1517983 RepID=A0ABV0S8W0_9TELE
MHRVVHVNTSRSTLQPGSFNQVFFLKQQTSGNYLCDKPTACPGCFHPSPQAPPNQYETSTHTGWMHMFGLNCKKQFLIYMMINKNKVKNGMCIYNNTLIYGTLHTICEYVTCDVTSHSVSLLLLCHVFTESPQQASDSL